MPATRNITRERLLEHGLEALLKHGYEGAGVGSVLAAARVPKGSFYHYFASKEAFAIAVIDAYEAQHAARRRELFEAADRAPLERLARYLDHLQREVEAAFPDGGCLYGMLSQTICARGAPLRKRLLAAFRHWQRALETLLEEAQAAGQLPRELDATETAALLIDAYEGVLLRIRAEHDPRLFAQFRRHVRRLLDAPATLRRSAARARRRPRA